MEQSQVERCCWLQRDRLMGCEGGNCGGKCLWRKARQPWKQGNIAESRVRGGAITIASLPPHASIGSWTIERLAHQMPEALNFRVGPHQGAPLSAWCTNLQSMTPFGGPLYVPDVPNKRKWSQGREPSKCMRVELRRKTCQRGLLIVSSKRLEKTLIGP